MPRDMSLSDSYTCDRCCDSSLEIPLKMGPPSPIIPLNSSSSLSLRNLNFIIKKNNMVLYYIIPTKMGPPSPIIPLKMESDADKM